MAITSFSEAADLQWRRGRAPGAEPAAKLSATFQRDSSVRQAAWDELAVSADSGPRLSSGAAGQAALRSVVVNRDDENASMRSAQLPQPGGDPGANTGGAGVGQTPADRDNFLEEMQRTFGAQPETQPGTQTPGRDRSLDTDSLPLPTDRPGTQPADRDLLTPEQDTPAEAIEAERKLAEGICTQELANLKTATLDKVILNINITGTAGRDFPFECSIDEGLWHAGRCWPETVYMWKASALCHKPLYFEDEGMERYGHSWGPCCDPIVSGVHFFTKLPVLPYCMGVEPPCECIYALGHYRPGSCAPYTIDPFPISCRGALFQAGAVVGAAAVLP